MIGHPAVIHEHFDDYINDQSDAFKKEVFGFVKCKVLPPKQLMFPILPMRYSGRLEFVLCGTCGESNAKDFCQHDDSQRCLIGTFATPELSDALANGYRVQEVYEILHWDTISDDLFRPFVNKWIKTKTESSGYPEWVCCEDDKATYISNYLHETGIMLETDLIQKDPIRRNIAKIMLNSFYGKFAQRSNLETTEIVRTYAKMWELANDPQKVITGLVDVGPNTMLVNWKLLHDDEARQGNVNVAIASFVTSYARRELWRKINEIESVSPGCVHYFDTDSIFYVAHEGMPLLKTGPLLGDLTREISEQEEVKTAVFLGPKNYAYVVRNKISGTERTILKVKGITLNAKALDILNVKTLMEMAQHYCFEGVTDELKIEQMRIKSTPNQRVTNQRLLKVYRAMSEKRIIRGNETFPKGYVKDSA